MEDVPPNMWGVGRWVAKGSERIEVAMESPEWLLSRWPGIGVGGGYLSEPPRAVVGHLIYTTTTQGIGKYLPFKVYGWWWHQVDMALRGVGGQNGVLPLLFPDR